MEFARMIWESGTRRSHFALCLVGLLFFAQLHVCATDYVTASGQSCEACQQIQLNSDCESGVVSLHGDCHDCCSVKACDDGSQEIAQSIPGTSFDFAVILPPVVENVAFIENAQQPIVIPFDPSAPTTGPPLNKSSRAPPVI